MGNKVALVLGSGGARGYAHIGVIEELETRGYEITCVAGCSMGAVVGGIYAAGKLGEYREWIESLDYFDMLRLVDPSFSLGAIRGEKIFGRIREMLGSVNIEDLPIPFTAVAADLTNQQEIWFQEGNLELAMRASAAIPSLFTPVMQGNRMLVDGGILNPLPIVPVVSSHSDIIIAVNLNANNHRQYPLPEVIRPGRFDAMVSSISSHLPFWRSKGLEEHIAELAAVGGPGEAQPPAAPSGQSAPKSAEGSMVIDVGGPASLLELINQSFEVMQSSLTQYKIAGYPPNVLVNIPKRACRFYEFYKAPELIKLGQIVASDALDKYESEQL
ncbi:MAG TPA: alpha/beta hydrolase [Pseudomonas sp.]|jgi:NTE family protein|uniref:patatin-like phospholipase family protein n=1 Tax=Stutzerimonas xanthomarina TaxID=271420 RepID=UPI000E8EE248|nr:patatin-like phospholipase family protein [Stutzerimonas xanthomarina]MBU0812380.1 patatin-like phospholipase family protein [Gammaproteobacteria bacterium]HAQ88260.1 alpha/beta hydrolase [Pseudomonas sp.]MBK3848647.1 alpha/beta hydrolase [Stutzerimonas xanthomarina]MBU0851968.1 patatin-like phospholipase family protein [Gammaproteobacteria bacterium]MBU1302408.1 patatin-like phospholipase family protein [Gammaproteobacteria bacterium]|tara:strand:+ start:1250 stop:2236 length:987 start_codon:yes stop_codon:yes gene_type:complete